MKFWKFKILLIEYLKYDKYNQNPKFQQKISIFGPLQAIFVVLAIFAKQFSILGHLFDVRPR